MVAHGDKRTPVLTVVSSRPEAIQRSWRLRTSGLTSIVGICALAIFIAAFVIAGFKSRNQGSALDAVLQDTPKSMIVELVGLDPQNLIPKIHAGCRLDGKVAEINAVNNHPGLRWSNAPPNAKSFAIIMLDRDAPSINPIGAFQSHRRHWNGVSRRPSIHWAVVDIPANAREILASAGGTANAGHGFKTTAPGRSGVTDFSFTVAAVARGIGHVGYLGPCPAPDDPIAHRYEFHVFAVDTERLDLPSNWFNGRSALHELRGRALGRGMAQASFRYASTAGK